MRRAMVLLGVAAACTLAGGWLIAVTWHLPYGRGLYCAVGTASTVGCDAVPGTAAGRAASVAVMLTAIPVLAACFAILTGHHASKRARVHLAAAEKRIAAEADQRRVLTQRHVERVLAGHAADLKRHVTAAVADGPAREGAGRNPAKSEGLPAEGPAVPPSATTTGGA